jgi:hypothetical protein
LQGHDLLRHRVKKSGTSIASLSLDDILIVAPYNMQVNLLRQRLPQGTKIGTVDKFQGQQAAAVIVSMTTSRGDDTPRGTDFLFNRNRFNVAISRAQCLAVVVHGKELFEAHGFALRISCESISLRRPRPSPSARASSSVSTQNAASTGQRPRASLFRRREHVDPDTGFIIGAGLRKDGESWQSGRQAAARQRGKRRRTNFSFYATRSLGVARLRHSGMWLAVLHDFAVNPFNSGAGWGAERTEFLCHV